jgi:hypothetical protein
MPIGSWTAPAHYGASCEKPVLIHSHTSIAIAKAVPGKPARPR